MLLSWEEARQECSYRGGYRRDGELASINTREEQTFMQSTSHQPPLQHSLLYSSLILTSIIVAGSRYYLPAFTFRICF